MPARGHGRPWLPHPGVQQQRNPLRLPRRHSHHRKCTNSTDQSLRPYQGSGGADAGRPAIRAPDSWRIASLRYFNPVGAHPSGRIGEDPTGIPTSLFPFVSQVAVGSPTNAACVWRRLAHARCKGVRDYIHVMDLAEGHRCALDCLLEEKPQLLTLNLGSGQGHSVLDVVKAMEAASNRSIPRITERRPGDAAISVADPSQALARRGWRINALLKTSAVTVWPGSRPIQTDTAELILQEIVPFRQHHTAVLELGSRLPLRELEMAQIHLHRAFPPRQPALQEPIDAAYADHHLKFSPSHPAGLADQTAVRATCPQLQVM